MKNVIFGYLVMFVLGTFVLCGSAYGIEKKCATTHVVKKAKKVKVVIGVDHVSNCHFAESPGETLKSYLKYTAAAELISKIEIEKSILNKPIKHFTAYVNNYKSVNYSQRTHLQIKRLA